MIGPPGIPKFGRPTFAFAGPGPVGERVEGPLGHRERLPLLKLAAGIYVAGVVAHFGHHMAMNTWVDGLDPSLRETLTSAPTSLTWPADLARQMIRR